jgi:hypothetical protein
VVDEGLRWQLLERLAPVLGFQEFLKGRGHRDPFFIEQQAFERLTRAAVTPSHDAKEKERCKAFVIALDKVLEALMHKPILQSKASATQADTAMSLQKLARRRAYAMLGAQTFAMETLDRAAGVSDEEFTRRYNQLLSQTHNRYCRPRAEVEAELRRRDGRKQERDDGEGGTAPARAPQPPPPPTPATPRRRSWAVES